MTSDDFKLLREKGFNYFVGAFGPIQEDGNVVFYHSVGYPEPPTRDDIDALINELATDDEFNMTALKYGVDYVLMPIDEDTFADE